MLKLESEKTSVNIIVVALSSPLQIGIYNEADEKIETFVSQEHTSEVLPLLFRDILQKYKILSIAYANGPGSFMSIKVNYLFLKTLCIVKKIPLFATDAFYFNKNQPIKAVAKLYFVKTSSGIETTTLSEVPNSVFELPEYFKKDDFNENTAPSYGIAAV